MRRSIRRRVYRRYASIVAVCCTFIFLVSSLRRTSLSDALAASAEDSSYLAGAPPAKLLFSTPRSGGFNNQLITIYEAVRCAQLLGRTLVLPLIYENVRADTSSKGVGPYPFDDYFDVDALRKVVHAVTPGELGRRHDPCGGGEVLFATSRHFYAHERRIPRLLKQQYSKPPYNLTAVFVKELARYNGRQTRDNAACIDDSACDASLFFRDDEFGSYSEYDQDGQGYSLRSHPRLRHIRAAFQPSPDVELIANDVLAHIGGRFNAMHVRRGDFADKCVELPDICHKYGEDALFQSPQAVKYKIGLLEDPNLPIFVSTTHPQECRDMLQDYNFNLVFMEDVPLRSTLTWAANRTDIIAYASQLVATKAEQFVGNRFSSFTTTINYMRVIDEQNAESLFF